MNILIEQLNNVISHPYKTVSGVQAMVLTVTPRRGIC